MIGKNDNTKKSTKLVNSMLEHLNSDCGLKELELITNDSNSPYNVYYNISTGSFTTELIIGKSTFCVNGATKVETLVKRFSLYSEKYFNDFLNLKTDKSRADKFLNGFWPAFDLSDFEMSIAINKLINEIDDSVNNRKCNLKLNLSNLCIDEYDITRANIDVNTLNPNSIGRALLIKDIDINIVSKIILKKYIDILMNSIKSLYSKDLIGLKNILKIILYFEIIECIQIVLNYFEYCVLNNVKIDILFDRFIRIVCSKDSLYTKYIKKRNINIFNEFQLKDYDFKQFEKLSGVININLYFTNKDKLFEALFTNASLHFVKSNTFITNDIKKTLIDYHNLMYRNKGFGQNHNYLSKMFYNISKLKVVEQTITSSTRIIEESY